MVVDQGWTHPRQALDRRLDGALTHRLTTLVAATGYGKSTLLSSWARAVGGASYRLGPADRDLTRFAAGVLAALRLRAPTVPAEILCAVAAPPGPDAVTAESGRAGALAGVVAETLAEHLSGDLVLILDGLSEVADVPGPCRFVDTLVRTAPARLHVVIASRAGLPFPIARLRQDHEVLQFDARDLAVTVNETADWLRGQVGDEGVRLAPSLHSATGGWPAAIHAAIDALARTDPAGWRRLVTDVSATSAGLESLLLQAYGALPTDTQRLLQAATIVPTVTASLAEALGTPPDALRTLAARGPFLDTDTDGYQLTPASRQVLRNHAPLDKRDAQDVASVAARWFVEHEAPDRAVRTAIAADHHALIASLLTTHGHQLVEHPDDVLAALDRVGELGGTAGPVNAEHLRLAGLAHFNQGDWDRASALLVQASEIGAFDSTVAYRIGLIAHLRGELDEALEVYRRGARIAQPAADAVLCTAMAASVHWLRGERATCASLADTAHEQAARLGDHRALAAAHTVLAMLAAYDGDGRANDAHYLKALDHASRAGDVAQQIRIRCNRASHRHTEGAFTESLAELEIAIRLCDLTGFAPWAALARSNRADTLIRLGRLEEAAVDAGDAVQRWEAMGSRLMGYGLTRQAQVQVLRGHSKAAAETFRRAIAFAERSGDAQGLSNALTGLADLLASTDPDAAATLTQRAAMHHVGTAVVSAWLAGARAALVAGRADNARQLLDQAEAEAVRRFERASLARVAELRAALDKDPARADEAVERWSAIGDPVGLARAELVRAALADPALGGEVAGNVKARMRATGCRVLDEEIDRLLVRAAPVGGPYLMIQTLGSFRVVRGGRPIPATAWQSRKARDLLKVLVARRGRPIARDQLVDILWPEAGSDDAAGKRLNVMISTLRSVLDPGREWPADYVVASAAGSVRIELANVTVDILDFLDTIAEAARLDQAGRPAEALERWRAAESAYTGDFCEDDVYADWATGLREEARLAYAQAAARIAGSEADSGRNEQAARYWLRLLERDPYDERAHLSLVRTLDRAGRRGDARRRYQAYADLMRELDIEPAPHPT